MSCVEETVFGCADLRREIFSYLRRRGKKICRTCDKVLVWDKKVRPYVETTWNSNTPAYTYCRKCWVDSLTAFGPPCMIS